MKTTILILLAQLFLIHSVSALEVRVTRGVDLLEVDHQGEMVTIMRDQDQSAVIVGEYAKTSRSCPPFCPQPMEIEGVKTIGEVELIGFLQTQHKEGFGLLVDARTSKWYQKGTIPGSINIPYTSLNLSGGADEFILEDALESFGVSKSDGMWDFSEAMTVVIWCNGPWCGQSPAAIRGLLTIGYPAEQILYYRGGMQAWKQFGLNVVIPKF
jgi:rhodanese-related sulfurtransferase